ncbi:MAG: glycoside hydrolase family 88 protein [bacterium]
MISRQTNPRPRVRTFSNLWLPLLVGLCTISLLCPACGDDDPTEDWSFYDACETGPPDEVCYVSKRDPASARVALALDVALRYIDHHPPTEQPWDWGPSALMFSLTELYRLTGDARLRDYYQAWMDHHIAAGHDLYWSDHCPAVLTALALLEDVGGAQYEAEIQAVLTYLFEEAPRIDGGISHMGTMDILGDTLWLDSLFMFGMVLTRWAEHTGDELYLDEIGGQFVIFRDLLQEDPGFLVHAYNWPQPQDPDVYWARGNGWVTASGYEYLRVRRNRGELGDPAVESLLSRQVEAILDTQDADTGLWWTVLNRPGETYLETSAAALFALGMARGYRYGFLGDEVLPSIASAVDGVEARITDDASGMPLVTGISGPTTAGDFQNYADIEQGVDIHYGVGAVILMLIETSGLFD